MSGWPATTGNVEGAMYGREERVLSCWFLEEGLRRRRLAESLGLPFGRCIDGSSTERSREHGSARRCATGLGVRGFRF